MLQCSISQPQTHQIHHYLQETQMMTAEQIVTAQKANVETLFGLTGKAFEGVEKLVELNLKSPRPP